MEFLDPKIDTAFKKLFGSEDRKNVTISFLNSILEYTGDRCIKSIQFLNIEQSGYTAEKKESFLDVLCKDQGGRQYIIEMQNALKPGFDKRMVWYGAKTYTSQLKAAAPYESLDPVVVIAICKKFILFPKKEHFKSIHSLIDKKTHENDLEDLTYVFIELLKFNKKENDLVTDEDKWLFLLKEIGSCDHIPEPLQQGEFKEACESLNRMSWSAGAYSLYEKKILDDKSAEELGRLAVMNKEDLAKARIEGLEAGRAAGLEAGLEAGREAGLEAGLEAGREAGREAERLQIAKVMLEKNLDIETISLITGLSVEQIKNI